MKLVVYPAVESERLEKFQAVADGMRIVNAPDAETAEREIPDADAFVGKITPRLLGQARNLKWVQCPTASLEHYLFPELVAHPCTLTNMRGLFSDVIADHVFGFILCFARNLHLYLRRQREGLWEPVGGEAARTDNAVGPGRVSAIDRAHLHLSDCTLGVIGFGGIGQEIGRRGTAFGMRVLALDPAVQEAPPGIESVWPVDRLPELLPRCDFVVIAAPHTPETAGWIRRPQLRWMKRTAYLINIGRGVIVPLDDLCAALDAGEIAGAALDVCEVEPLPPDHSLWRRENVIITPHVAAASVRIAERHLDVLLDNIQRFAAGQPLRNVASKTAWY
ncbi:MAG: D-2-hydroxyacid dehydrogenase [Pirellulaceae bacterium]